MIQFILDTDTLTLIQEGHPEVCGHFLQQPADNVAITVLSVEEQLSGWYTQVRQAKRPERLACIGPELGGVLRLLFTGNMLKLNRLAKHLDTAARASLLHAHVCAQIVQTACIKLTHIPKDLHHLLGPLLEWLTAGSQAVRSDFCAVLENVTTGKAGSLAKRLLQLTFAPERGRRFLVDSLEGRLQRARRWASLKDDKRGEFEPGFKANPDRL